MKTKAGPKVFVLDTNVLLHDSGCLDNFEDNDIVVPIAVLEELDRFKKGNQEIHAHARACLRRIDELDGVVSSPGGAPLGPGRGHLRVALGDARRTLEATFVEDTPDHRILATALAAQAQLPERRVVLVSKDTNLRVKARALGLPAEDYTSDKVDSLEQLYTGRRLVEHLPESTIARLYRDGGRLPLAEVPEIGAPTANESFILRNGSVSALARHRPREDALVRVAQTAAYGIRPRNAEQAFALDVLLDDDVQLVTLVGKAGTGKTLLALAAALECRRRYRQVLLARPIVPLSNRDIGYLPGDADAKIDPFMRPLFDNLAVIAGEASDSEDAAQRIGRMREQEKLVITPLAYIRGRSLQRVFFIVDEAQNLTPHEVKTIVTRAGQGTKVVLTGDVRQIDQPYLDSLSNGLSHVISRMKGQPLYGHVTLEKGERSPLADVASTLL